MVYISALRAIKHELCPRWLFSPVGCHVRRDICSSSEAKSLSSAFLTTYPLPSELTRRSYALGFTLLRESPTRRVQRTMWGSVPGEGRAWLSHCGRKLQRLRDRQVRTFWRRCSTFLSPQGGDRPTQLLYKTPAEGYVPGHTLKIHTGPQCSEFCLVFGWLVGVWLVIPAFSFPLLS